MKPKTVVTVLLCLAAVLLLGIGASAASALRPLTASAGPVAASARSMPTPVISPASGTWTWWYVDGGFSWDADYNGWSFHFNNAERGRWTGTFRGTSVEPWSFYIDADGNAWALISIHFKGRVHGHGGTAVIQLTVDLPYGSPSDEMGGHWAVASSTGGLRHLFGMGTWSIKDPSPYAKYTGFYWLP